MKKYIWPIRVNGVTYDMAGKKHIIDATIEGSPNAAQAVLDYVLNKKNAHIWIGEGVSCITPVWHCFSVLIERGII